MSVKQASTEQSQTIEVLEADHATIWTTLSLASGKNRKQWHTVSSIAILNYHTPYRSNFDGEPSRVFHGRDPHNIFDHKLGLPLSPKKAPTTDFVDELFSRTKYLQRQKPRKNSCCPTTNTNRTMMKNQKLAF